MKIITVTFFYDFARYFEFIESQLKIEMDLVEFYNVSLYPCAHHYWKKNNKHSILSTSIKSNDGQYSLDKDDELVKKLIYFNKKTFNLYGRNEEKKLKNKAIIYLNYFDNLFKKEKFNFLISSGESRLLPSVIIYIAKIYKVKIIYFEQGPFGTTMFDVKGVNANISFKPVLQQLSDVQKNKLEKFKNNLVNQKVKFWNKEKFTLLDNIFRIYSLIYLYQPKIFKNYLSIDLSSGPYFLKGFLIPKIFNIYNKNKLFPIKYEKKIISSRKYIALYLQVPVDAQLIEHSPFYKSFTTMVKDIISVIPEGYDLAIREHPQYLGKYDPTIYSLISNNSNVKLENHIELNDLILGSSCSIVNNSAVGIESLLLGKNVICLGKSYYSHRGLTYDYEGTKDSLKKCLFLALNNSPNIESINYYFYHLIFNYLQKGHFQDHELTFPQRLLENIKLLNKDEI